MQFYSLLVYIFFNAKIILSCVAGYVIGTLGGFGVTGGAHRLWAHRSYKAKWPLKVFLLYCYSIAGQVKSLQQSIIVALIRCKIFRHPNNYYVGLNGTVSLHRTLVERVLLCFRFSLAQCLLCFLIHFQFDSVK